MSVARPSPSPVFRLAVSLARWRISLFYFNSPPSPTVATCPVSIHLFYTQASPYRIFTLSVSTFTDHLAVFTLLGPSYFSLNRSLTFNLNSSTMSDLQIQLQLFPSFHLQHSQCSSPHLITRVWLWAQVHVLCPLMTMTSPSKVVRSLCPSTSVVSLPYLLSDYAGKTENHLGTTSSFTIFETCRENNQ